MPDEVPLYDRFSADYDVMVDWPGRLAREWPFFEAALAQVQTRDGGPQRALDVGCGTGRHAVYLAQKGCAVIGADPSEPMLARARTLAAGVSRISFVRAGFGELRASLSGTVDLVTCLGNTLPHATDRAALFAALADMSALLRPGGLLIVQQLNYDRICARRQRFLGLSSGKSGDEEVLFFRFYDFVDPLLNFNVVTLRRLPASGWTFQAEATILRPISHDELAELLALAGFDRVDYYGGYDRTPFDPTQSNDLIAVAEKRRD